VPITDIRRVVAPIDGWRVTSAAGIPSASRRLGGRPWRVLRASNGLPHCKKWVHDKSSDRSIGAAREAVGKLWPSTTFSPRIGRRRPTGLMGRSGFTRTDSSPKSHTPSDHWQNSSLLSHEPPSNGRLRKGRHQRRAEPEDGDWAAKDGIQPPIRPFPMPTGRCPALAELQRHLKGQVPQR
jgi:hypothetical protein